MTAAERKAVGYLIRLGAGMFAATKDNAPIWDNRESMAEYIGQFVEERMPLFDVDGYLAEVLITANAEAKP